MAIVTILAIKTDIHGYHDYTSLETDIHLSGIEPGIECKELVASLLRCCPFLAQDTLSRSIIIETGEATQVLASRAGNVGGMDTGGWGGVFPRLSSSSSLVILTCQYVLWIKASQPITYLELQGKLPRSQSLQNHS